MQKLQLIHNKQLPNSCDYHRIVYRTTLVPRPDKYKSFILNATVPKSFSAGSYIEIEPRVCLKNGNWPAAASVTLDPISHGQNPVSPPISDFSDRLLGQPVSNRACQNRPNIMDLPNAIERLWDVLRLQHKAISTEDSYEGAESVGIDHGGKNHQF